MAGLTLSNLFAGNGWLGKFLVPLGIKGAYTQLGVVIALPLLIIVSAYGSTRFRWRPTLLMAAGLTIFCVFVFLKGLGIPLPIIGPWLGG